ncbi:MAG: TolC family protein [Hydrogenimonas sp.]|nr:TolC family protein [Hydrogenimonas sp.]
MRIAAADYTIERAKNFDNPVLGLGINDIRLDEPANRSLERMQTQSVKFSQKIPWFGKRDTKEAIKKTAKRLLFASLKEAESMLFARIKQSAYRLWETERLIEITRQTIALTEQNIELFEAYTASSDSGNTHMGIMSAELVKSRLKTSLKRLIAQKERILALLSYLSFRDVRDVEVDLSYRNIPPLKDLILMAKKSPIVKIEEAKELIENRRLDLSRLQSGIDPVVSLGYFQRSSYEDYISIGIGFSLPIYGTEESEVQERRALLLAQRSRVADSKKRVVSKVKGLLAEAKSSQEIVNIIENESLPQIDHMFDLIRSDIAAGGDLYKFVDLVEQKLRLDAEAISARAKYYITLAEIEAILGEQL